MIWFRNPNPDAPKLQWRKPDIPESMLKSMRGEHPTAVPAHCKPWIDGQSYAVDIPWTGPNIVLKFNKYGLDHTALKDIMIHSFAEGHFSMQPGYYIKTQQNVGIFISPSPKSKLVAVVGLVETDWYPMMPFFVFKNPPTYEFAPTVSINLNTGDTIAQVQPVILDRGLQEMTDEQFNAMLYNQQDYLAERMSRHDLLWVSDRGQGFSRLYKEKSGKRARS